MPAPIDLAVVVTLAVLWPAWEHYVAWPRTVRRIDSAAPGARAGEFRRILVMEWALVAATAIAWRVQGHAWEALPLYAPGAWRIVVGVVIVLALAGLMTHQVLAVRRSAKTRAAIRRGMARASVDRLMPRTASERTWWIALSATAGVCEEWLFRGVLTMLLASWFGLPIAVILANIAFAFGHAYQGPRRAVVTGFVGLVMSGIVLATGSLVPAMIVHAVLDTGSGLSGHFAVMMPDPEEGTGEASAAAG